MPIFGRFEITDGTTTIDLLNNHPSGFLITDWQPAIPDLKSGGSWADPPTADERELIVGQLADVEEQFTFDVVAANPDQLIGYLRDLRAMLTKARQYTLTTWQDTPVYLVAQGYQESNVRYTRVKNWRTPQDGNPYAPPMWGNIQGTSIDDYSVIIEHGAWLSNPPGVGTATEISAMETYDGRNLGNVDDTGTRDPSSTNAVYVANKRNEANLTDIYTWSAANGWSVNLMDAALPFDLIDDVGAAPAVNDYIVFIIDTALANSGPFSSLVFDVGTVGAGYTGHWEYWNGAWVALTVQDNTLAVETFDVLGINSVSWVQPSDWVVNNPGVGITGYCARYILDTLPGGYITPTQQNRKIYTVTWPYVEVQSTAVGGDVPALAQFDIMNWAGSTTPVVHLGSNWIMAGLRSVSRGASFTAYLNAANEQNPAGVSFFASGPTGAIVVNDVTSAAGRVTNITYGVPGHTGRLDWTLDETIEPDFRGKFRVFLRVKQSGGAVGDITVQVTYFMGTVGHIRQEADIKYPQYIGYWEAIDFGILTWPLAEVDNSVGVNLMGIDVSTGRTAGAATLRVSEVILIPIDEWVAEANTAMGITPRLGHSSTNEVYLDLDSVTRPKTSMQSLIKDLSNGNVDSFWISLANGPAIWQANSRQRLWFLSEYVSSANRISPNETLLGAHTTTNQRYYSMRGGS